MKLWIYGILLGLFIVDLAYTKNHQEFDRTAGKLSNDFLTLARKKGKDAQVALNRSLAILWSEDEGWIEWRKTQGNARRRAFHEACKNLKSGDVWMVWDEATEQKWTRDSQVLASDAVDRPPQCGDSDQWADDSEVEGYAQTLAWMERHDRVELTLLLIDVSRKGGANARDALNKALELLWPDLDGHGDGSDGFKGGFKAWRGMAGNSNRHNFVESCSNLGGRWMDLSKVEKCNLGYDHSIDAQECTHFADHDNYFQHVNEHVTNAPPLCEEN